jgi:hypothetical protein
MSSLKERTFSQTEAAAGSDSEPFAETPCNLPEVVIGWLVGLGGKGEPLVDYPGNPRPEPLPALATASCGQEAVGRELALLFADGDPLRPLIIGLIHDTKIDVVAEPEQALREDAQQDQALEVRLDGDRLLLSADKEIVLKCGKASITLTRAGKILLRGAYLLSRSSGVNRIKGGSVQIN